MTVFDSHFVAINVHASLVEQMNYEQMPGIRQKTLDWNCELFPSNILKE